MANFDSLTLSFKAQVNPEVDMSELEKQLIKMNKLVLAKTKGAKFPLNFDMQSVDQDIETVRNKLKEMGAMPLQGVNLDEVLRVWDTFEKNFGNIRVNDLFSEFSKQLSDTGKLFEASATWDKITNLLKTLQTIEMQRGGEKWLSSIGYLSSNPSLLQRNKAVENYQSVMAAQEKLDAKIAQFDQHIANIRMNVASNDELKTRVADAEKAMPVNTSMMDELNKMVGKEASDQFKDRFETLTKSLSQFLDVQRQIQDLKNKLKTASGDDVGKIEQGIIEKINEFRTINNNVMDYIKNISELAKNNNINNSDITSVRNFIDLLNDMLKEGNSKFSSKIGNIDFEKILSQEENNFRELFTAQEKTALSNAKNTFEGYLSREMQQLGFGISKKFGIYDKDSQTGTLFDGSVKSKKDWESQLVSMSNSINGVLRQFRNVTDEATKSELGKRFLEFENLAKLLNISEKSFAQRFNLKNIDKLKEYAELFKSTEEGKKWEPRFLPLNQMVYERTGQAAEFEKAKQEAEELGKIISELGSKAFSKNDTSALDELKNKLIELYNIASKNGFTQSEFINSIGNFSQYGEEYKKIINEIIVAQENLTGSSPIQVEQIETAKQKVQELGKSISDITQKGINLKDADAIEKLGEKLYEFYHNAKQANIGDNELGQYIKDYEKNYGIFKAIVENFISKHNELTNDFSKPIATDQQPIQQVSNKKEEGRIEKQGENKSTGETARIDKETTKTTISEAIQEAFNKEYEVKINAPALTESVSKAITDGINASQNEQQLLSSIADMKQFQQFKTSENPELRLKALETELTYWQKISELSGSLGEKRLSTVIGEKDFANAINAEQLTSIINTLKMEIDSVRQSMATATQEIQTQAGTQPITPNVDTTTVSEQVKTAIKEGSSEKQDVNVNTDGIKSQVNNAVSSGVQQANAAIQKPEQKTPNDNNIPPVEVPIKPIKSADFDEQLKGLVANTTLDVKVNPVLKTENVTAQASEIGKNIDNSSNIADAIQNALIDKIDQLNKNHDPIFNKIREIANNYKQIITDALNSELGESFRNINLNDTTAFADITNKLLDKIMQPIDDKAARLINEKKSEDYIKSVQNTSKKLRGIFEEEIKNSFKGFQSSIPQDNNGMINNTVTMAMDVSAVEAGKDKITDIFQIILDKSKVLCEQLANIPNSLQGINFQNLHVDELNKFTNVEAFKQLDALQFDGLKNVDFIKIKNDIDALINNGSGSAGAKEVKAPESISNLSKGIQDRVTQSLSQLNANDTNVATVINNYIDDVKTFIVDTLNTKLTEAFSGGEDSGSTVIADYVSNMVNSMIDPLQKFIDENGKLSAFQQQAETIANKISETKRLIQEAVGNAKSSTGETGNTQGSNGTDITINVKANGVKEAQETILNSFAVIRENAQATIEQINAIKDALAGLKEKDTAEQKIQTVASSLTQQGASAMTSVCYALKNLDSVDLTRVTTKGLDFSRLKTEGIDAATLRAIASVLSALQNIDLSKFNISNINFKNLSTANAVEVEKLKPIADALKALSSVDFTKFNLSGINFQNLKTEGIDVAVLEKLSNLKFDNLNALKDVDFSNITTQIRSVVSDINNQFADKVFNEKELLTPVDPKFSLAQNIYKNIVDNMNKSVKVNADELVAPIKRVVALIKESLAGELGKSINEIGTSDLGKSNEVFNKLLDNVMKPLDSTKIKFSGNKEMVNYISELSNGLRNFYSEIFNSTINVSKKGIEIPLTLKTDTSQIETLKTSVSNSFKAIIDSIESLLIELDKIQEKISTVSFKDIYKDDFKVALTDIANLNSEIDKLSKPVATVDGKAVANVEPANADNILNMVNSIQNKVIEGLSRLNSDDPEIVNKINLYLSGIKSKIETALNSGISNVYDGVTISGTANVESLMQSILTSILQPFENYVTETQINDSFVKKGQQIASEITNAKDALQNEINNSLNAATQDVNAQAPEISQIISEKLVGTLNQYKTDKSPAVDGIKKYVKDIGVSIKDALNGELGTVFNDLDVTDTGAVGSAVDRLMDSAMKPLTEQLSKMESGGKTENTINKFKERISTLKDALKNELSSIMSSFATPEGAASSTEIQIPIKFTVDSTEMENAKGQVAVIVQDINNSLKTIIETLSSFPDLIASINFNEIKADNLKTIASDLQAVADSLKAASGGSKGKKILVPEQDAIVETNDLGKGIKDKIENSLSNLSISDTVITNKISEFVKNIKNKIENALRSEIGTLYSSISTVQPEGANEFINRQMSMIMQPFDNFALNESYKSGLKGKIDTFKTDIVNTINESAKFAGLEASNDSSEPDFAKIINDRLIGKIEQLTSDKSTITNGLSRYIQSIKDAITSSLSGELGTLFNNIDVSNVEVKSDAINRLMDNILKPLNEQMEKMVSDNKTETTIKNFRDKIANLRNALQSEISSIGVAASGFDSSSTSTNVDVKLNVDTSSLDSFREAIRLALEDILNFADSITQSINSIINLIPQIDFANMKVTDLDNLKNALENINTDALSRLVTTLTSVGDGKVFNLKNLDFSKLNTDGVNIEALNNIVDALIRLSQIDLSGVNLQSINFAKLKTDGIDADKLIQVFQALEKLSGKTIDLKGLNIADLKSLKDVNLSKLNADKLNVDKLRDLSGLDFSNLEILKDLDFSKLNLAQADVMALKQLTGKPEEKNNNLSGIPKKAPFNPDAEYIKSMGGDVIEDYLKNYRLKAGETIQNIQRFYDINDNLKNAVITIKSEVEELVNGVKQKVIQSYRENIGYTYTPGNIEAGIDEKWETRVSSSTINDVQKYIKEQTGIYNEQMKNAVKSFNDELSNGISEDSYKSLQERLENIHQLVYRIMSEGYIEVVDKNALRNVIGLEDELNKLADTLANKFVDENKNFFSLLKKSATTDTTGESNAIDKQMQESLARMQDYQNQLAVLTSGNEELNKQVVSTMNESGVFQADYADALAKRYVTVSQQYFKMMAKLETGKTGGQTEQIKGAMSRMDEEMKGLQTKLSTMLDVNPELFDAIIDKMKQVAEAAIDCSNAINNNQSKNSENSIDDLVQRYNEAAKKYYEIKTKLETTTNSPAQTDRLNSDLQSYGDQIISIKEHIHSLTQQDAQAQTQALNRMKEAATYEQQYKDALQKSINDQFNMQSPLDSAERFREELQSLVGEFNSFGKKNIDTSQLERMREIVSQIKDKISEITRLGLGDLVGKKLINNAGNLEGKLSNIVTNNENPPKTNKDAEWHANKAMAAAKVYYDSLAKVANGKDVGQENVIQQKITQSYLSMIQHMEMANKLSQENLEIRQNVLNILEREKAMQADYVEKVNTNRDKGIIDRYKSLSQEIANIFNKQLPDMMKNGNYKELYDNVFNSIREKISNLNSDFNNLGENASKAARNAKAAFEQDLSKSGESIVAPFIKQFESLKTVDTNGFVASIKEMLDAFQQNATSGPIQDMLGRLESFKTLNIIDDNDPEQAKTIKETLNEAAELINRITGPTGQIGDINSINKDYTRFKSWLGENPKASYSADYKDRIKAIEDFYTAVSNGATVSKQDVENFRKSINGLMADASKTGAVGKSFFDLWMNRMKSMGVYLTSFLSFYRIVGTIKSAVNTIKTLDTALVDLKKTTTMSVSELNSFYLSSNQIAKDLGVSTQQVIEQAAAWSRLGFQSKEAAETMAKVSSQFAAISPGMSTDESTSGLVSIMKAFDIKADTALEDIVSKINIVGKLIAHAS